MIPTWNREQGGSRRRLQGYIETFGFDGYIYFDSSGCFMHAHICKNISKYQIVWPKHMYCVICASYIKYTLTKSFIKE